MVTQQPLAIVSLPSLSRLQGDQAKMCQVVCRGMELNAVISFAVFVGLAAIAPELGATSLWCQVGGGCHLVFYWLSLSALVEALLVFFYPILLASGGIGKYVWLNIWHTAGVVVACLVGIRFGITFLVMGLIMNNLIIAIPSLLFVCQRIGLSPSSYCKPCLVPALAAIFMIGMIWLMSLMLPTDISSIFRIVSKVLIGGIAYVVSVFLFDPSVLKTLTHTIGHAFHRSSILPIPR